MAGPRGAGRRQERRRPRPGGLAASRRPPRPPRTASASSGKRPRRAWACSRRTWASLESKISEAQTKKELLIARSRRADAETRIQQERSSQSGSSNALAAFERLEGKVDEKEAQAAAYGELAGDSLESRFEKLNAGPPVDDELALLKAKRENKLLGEGSAKQE